MNRRIRQLAAAFIVLYVVLFAALNYWQVGRESELNAMGGNTRAIRREFSRPRGEIVSAEGVVAARSIPLPDDNEFPYQREYPTGELFANVTGYYSLALGATQLERTQNAVLTGQTAEQRIGNLEDIVTGGEGTGDVHMTLRADLQETAREALAGRRGSVVMLDVQTGAVLAMYSNPTYDPNRIVDPDFDAARVALEELARSSWQPAARQRLPGALHARFDVQGADHGDRLGVRRRLPRQPVRPGHRVDATADLQPDSELRRLELRW